MNGNLKTRKKRNKFIGSCGDIFGRLTLTGLTYTKTIYGHWVRFVEVVCQCGEVKELPWHRIASGETQSCGCYRKDATRKRKTSHGLTDHLLYGVWQSMVERCYNKNSDAFKNYGARGIEVWRDWKEDFTVFYDWCMANGYKKGLSLDRKDNDGHYAPYNCWFVTRAEQSRNKRNNRFYSAFGETKCLRDWAKDARCAVGFWTLRGRMDKPFWEDKLEEALTVKSDLLRGHRNGKVAIKITAFGESKCMTEWLEDERCVVKLDSIRERYRKGWDGEKILTTPPHSSGKKGIILNK